MEKGVIIYGKSGWDLARGKIHGTLDVGLSVITTKPRDGRIDVDGDAAIYHLKVRAFQPQTIKNCKIVNIYSIV